MSSKVEEYVNLLVSNAAVWHLDNSNYVVRKNATKTKSNKMHLTAGAEHVRISDDVTCSCNNFSGASC